jgi:DNA-binding NarL/FixJ family response regulator
MTARIVLAEDDALMLNAIRKLLDGDFEIVGAASDGHELVQQVMRLEPDIVVLDISMPRLNGMEAARQIRESLPDAKIVVLTQYADRPYIEEAFRLGASAYVVKQKAASELRSALILALDGCYFVSATAMDPEIAARFDPKRNPGGLFGGRLKPRQREILRFMAKGKSTKEIASMLGISQRTVEFYREEIMDELGISTVTDLTRYAAEHGILQ